MTNKSSQKQKGAEVARIETGFINNNRGTDMISATVAAMLTHVIIQFANVSFVNRDA